MPRQTRQRCLRRCMGAALLLLAGIGVASAAAERCRAVAIDRLGFAELETREQIAQARWLELGDQWLVCGADTAVLDATAGLPLLREAFVASDALLLVAGFRPADANAPTPLAQGGRLAVLTRVEAQALAAAQPADGHRHVELAEVPWNRVLVRRADNDPRRARRAASTPHSDALVAAIDGERWLADVGTLAGWDRHSLRSGILDARDWVRDRFAALPGVTVALDPFLVSGVTAYNVVATLPGSQRPEQVYIVGGHYDAIGGTFSPGAEDNASGCAGVIEIARVFAATPPPATLVFVCYAGEEQGLYGSQHQVGALAASGDSANVAGMLNMDMIGYTGDAELDCLLETGAAFADLVTVYADAAARYTTLAISSSLYPFGSDHVPFINAGMPALLTIENDWDVYPDYHRSTDVFANVDLQMGYQTLRMNVGALATLLQVDAGSVFADGFESAVSRPR